jgi:hypothetical protein
MIEVPSIVLDCGTMTKSGLAGDDAPLYVYNIIIRFDRIDPIYSQCDVNRRGFFEILDF